MNIIGKISLYYDMLWEVGEYKQCTISKVEPSVPRLNSSPHTYSEVLGFIAFTKQFQIL